MVLFTMYNTLQANHVLEGVISIRELRSSAYALLDAAIKESLSSEFQDEESSRSCVNVALGQACGQ